jgi:hypothetical protein
MKEDQPVVPGTVTFPELPSREQPLSKMVVPMYPRELCRFITETGTLNEGSRGRDQHPE